MRTKKAKLLLSTFMLLLAIVLSVCSLGILTARAEVGGDYKVDNFTALPSDWEYNEGSAPNTTATATQDGGLTLSNLYWDGPNATHYWGGLYEIAQGREWADFTFKMNFTYDSSCNDDASRYFRLLFHTQKGLNAEATTANGDVPLISGYAYAHRYAGELESYVYKSTAKTDANCYDGLSVAGMGKGTTHEVAITMEGTTAKYYFDKVLFNTWDTSTADATIGGRQTSGGFAIVLNKTTITVNSIEITDKAVEIEEEKNVTGGGYTLANFAEVPTDLELEAGSDTTNASAPAVSDGNLVLKHKNPNDGSVDASVYWGAIYHIAVGRTWEDFTFNMTFTASEPSNDRRYFDVVAHTGAGTYFSGYGAHFRIGGTHATEVYKRETKGATTVLSETSGGVALTDGREHTVTVTMENMVMKYYMDGIFLREWDTTGADATIGTRQTSGGFALVLNGIKMTISSINITDTVADMTTAPVAPASAEYTATEGLATYRADGFVAITAEEGNVPARYRAYWANANGALADYGAFRDVVSTGLTTIFELPDYSVVPTGADRLIIYSYSTMNGLLSENFASAILTGKSGDLGTAQSEFQVASDIHIRSTVGDTYNDNFASLLEQINHISPNSDGLFMVGDITNGDDVDPKYVDAVPQQWTNFNDIITASGLDKNKIYPVAGNHEYFVYGDLGVSATRDANSIRDYLNGTSALGFSSNSSRTAGTTADKMYYYVDIAGSRFIMLSGLECRNNNAAYLGQTQRDWFAQTLASAPAGPVYVFLHQGLKDTVAGTHGLTGTLPVSTEDETFIRNQLANYPRAIYFSGHSHAQLGADSLYVSDDLTVVNTASVAYTWNEQTNTNAGGSEAWFAYTYKDKVVFKGRDLKNGTWIPEAQFVVEVAETHEHEVEYKAYVEATDAEDGHLEHWYCETCDKCYANAEGTQEVTKASVTLAKHTLQHVTANPSSDTQTGNIEYWYCAECDKYYSDASATAEITQAQTVVAKHTLQHVTANSATHTTAGNIEYWYCAECEKYYSDANATEEITQAQTVLAKIELVMVEAKEATEDGDGNVKYWYCEECGKYYADASASTEIAKADTVVKYEAPDNTGLIVGLIVGGVVVAGGAVALVFILKKRKGLKK